MRVASTSLVRTCAHLDENTLAIGHLCLRVMVPNLLRVANTSLSLTKTASTQAGVADGACSPWIPRTAGGLSK